MVENNIGKLSITLVPALFEKGDGDFEISAVEVSPSLGGRMLFLPIERQL